MAGAGELEIERRFLIHMPDSAYFASLKDAEIWDIVQNYLTDGSDGCTRRIRSIESDGNIKYIYTEKNRLGGITHAEREWQIDRAEYEALQRQIHPSCRPIIKRRYRFAYRAQLLEMDIFTFWQDRAILEIEISDENQRVYLPDEIRIIRDISTEGAYKNRRMAERVPMETI